VGNGNATYVVIMDRETWKGHVCLLYSGLILSLATLPLMSIAGINATTTTVAASGFLFL